MNRSRTWLFVPGNSERKLASAGRSGADVIIIDLEDSVPQSERDAARALVAGAVLPPAGQATYVRMSAERADAKDLESAVRAGIEGLLMPKSTLEAVVEVADRLGRLEERRGLRALRLVPLIETARGLEEAVSIGRSSTRVRCLAFGPLDFARDLGIPGEPSGSLLDYARATLVVASARAGLEMPVDGPVEAIDDEAAVNDRARRSRAMGFQGLLVIHPRQIAPVHAAFSPTRAEIAEAREVVASYAAALARGAGAIRHAGRMIDAANIERYRRMLVDEPE